MRGWSKRIAEGLRTSVLISSVTDMLRRDVTTLVSRVYQSAWYRNQNSTQRKKTKTSRTCRKERRRRTTGKQLIDKV